MVVAEDPLARAALARTVDAASSLRVVEQVAQPTRGVQADAFLWDTGLHASELGALTAAVERAPVVALVADESAADLALEAGARGVLLREAGDELLVAALECVVRGLAVLSPELMRTQVRASAPSFGVDALTPREHEVLELLVEGLSNKEIAQRLGVSDHTAKFHVAAVLAKLGVQTRTEAVVRAARSGLVTL